MVRWRRNREPRASSPSECPGSESLVERGREEPSQNCHLLEAIHGLFTFYKPKIGRKWKTNAGVRADGYRRGPCCMSSPVHPSVRA